MLFYRLFNLFAFENKKLSRSELKYVTETIE